MCQGNGNSTSVPHLLPHSWTLGPCASRRRCAAATVARCYCVYHTDGSGSHSKTPKQTSASSCDCVIRKHSAFLSSGLVPGAARVWPFSFKKWRTKAYPPLVQRSQSAWRCISPLGRAGWALLRLLACCWCFQSATCRTSVACPTLQTQTQTSVMTLRSFSQQIKRHFLLCVLCKS